MAPRKVIPPFVRIAKRCEVEDRGYVTRCWVYAGYVGASGYAVMTLGRHGDGTRRVALVHRVAYEEIIGPIPEGLHLDHLCRVRHCCNPDHLEPVEPRENLMRGYGFAGRNFRKTHCSRGHEFTEANTYTRAGTSIRACRACGRLRTADYRNATEEEG